MKLLTRFLLSGLVVLLVSWRSVQAQDDRPQNSGFDVKGENFLAWRDHILPKPDELAWKKIPWHANFKDAILEANEVKKPILLWTMNGHPLGCT